MENEDIRKQLEDIAQTMSLFQASANLSHELLLEVMRSLPREQYVAIVARFVQERERFHATALNSQSTTDESLEMIRMCERILLRRLGVENP